MRSACRQTTSHVKRSVGGETAAAFLLSKLYQRPTERQDAQTAVFAVIKPFERSDGQRQRRRAERRRKEATRTKATGWAVVYCERGELLRRGGGDRSRRRWREPRAVAVVTRSAATVTDEAQGGTLFAKHTICTKFGKPHLGGTTTPPNG